MKYYTHSEINSKFDQIKKTLEEESSVETYFRKYLIEYFKEKNNNCKIVDIGAGNGNLLKLLTDMGFTNIIAIDIDNYLSDEIKKNIPFEKCNISIDKLPFNDNSIDIITCIQVIEHIENPWHFVREVNRVLKPNGFLVISFPSSKDIFSRILFLLEANVYSYTPKNNHISFFTQAIQNKLFSNFEVIEEYYTKSRLKRLRKLQRLFNVNIWLPPLKLFSIKTLYSMKKK